MPSAWRALLTLAEAAAHYGCAITTVKSAIARGALPATKFGRALAIRREDLPRGGGHRAAAAGRKNPEIPCPRRRGTPLYIVGAGIVRANTAALCRRPA